MCGIAKVSLFQLDRNAAATYTCFHTKQGYKSIEIIAEVRCMEKGAPA
jgi:hypothetical protein